MGITPAYAGKREQHISDKYPLLGSPPPMRGKVNGIALACVIAGITPAYAGKSKASDHR